MQSRNYSDQSDENISLISPDDESVGNEGDIGGSDRSENKLQKEITEGSREPYSFKQFNDDVVGGQL